MQSVTDQPAAVPATESSVPAAWQLRAAVLLRHERITVALLGLLAAFILFWRLAEPPKYIYDEVYHSFTGNLMIQNDPKVYEWWQSAQPNPIEGVQYEWTHPPLGKLIIGASIKLWGNNSLGWRFGNAVWGVGCVLLLYLLVRQLFRDRWVALLAGLFLLIEGLMFAEARIGTNDIFQLGFLLAAYNCFVFSLRRPARDGVPWLYATGLFLGFALATKWPAIFSIGLMAAVAVVRALWPGRHSALGTRHSALGTRHPAPGTRHPARGTIGYLLSAVLALVALPVALYVLSYLQMYLQRHQIPREYAGVGPLHVGPVTLGPSTLGAGNWWDMFLGEQWQMWNYHTTLHDNHPYYSAWWQWLLDIRPVFYYVNRTNGIVANSYALGNPAIYWVFPLAILGGLVLIWKHRQVWLALVMAAFLINWLPWARSPRGLFFYHFLPSIPFLVTLLAYGVVTLWRQPAAGWRRLAGWYVVAVCVSFAFFYTQLSAWQVPQWYADLHYWLPSWQ